MRQTIDFLYDLYAFINHSLFQNELPATDQVIITVEKDGRSTKVLGTFSKPSGWCREDVIIPYKICLSPFYLHRSATDLGETLLHEMTHLLCEIEGTEKPGSYHNEAFRAAASKHGLAAEKVGKKGYAKTSLTPETVQLLEKHFADNPPPKSLIYKKQPPKTHKLPSSSKHVCPSCQLTIRAPYPPPQNAFQCPMCLEEMCVQIGKKKIPRTFSI